MGLRFFLILSIGLSTSAVFSKPVHSIIRSPLLPTAIPTHDIAALQFLESQEERNNSEVVFHLVDISANDGEMEPVPPMAHFSTDSAKTREVRREFSFSLKCLKNPWKCVLQAETEYVKGNSMGRNYN